jgi:hypothetical protein
MRVNLSAVIRDLKGEVIKDGKNDLTLSTVCCGALLTPLPDETNLSADEKVRRFKLAVKLCDGGQQDLSSEEITMLKQLVGKVYPPLTVGRAFEILDPDAAASIKES